EALLQRPEVLLALEVPDDDLAIEDVTARHELELGEIAPQGPARPRLQLDLAIVHECQRAEPVVLRLIAPLRALGEGRAGLRELRLQRRGGGQRPPRDASG